MPIGTHGRRATAMLVMLSACSRGPAAGPPEPVQASMTARATSPLDGSTQLVLVVTPAWDSTSGSLRRFERDGARARWRQVGDSVAVVVGRTGVAWDGQLGLGRAGEPVKREGDGRSPA